MSTVEEIERWEVFSADLGSEISPVILSSQNHKRLVVIRLLKELHSLTEGAQGSTAVVWRMGRRALDTISQFLGEEITMTERRTLEVFGLPVRQMDRAGAEIQLWCERA